VFYVYPDEESETVRTELRKHGVDVEEYEKDETLHLESSGKFYMPNGKLDFEKAVIHGLDLWNNAKKRKYKHARVIGDVGDFSAFNGQWQKYVTDYWLDPRWNDPNVSEWVESKGPADVKYKPFIMEITAINVERMSEAQIRAILKAFGGGKSPPTKLIASPIHKRLAKHLAVKFFLMSISTSTIQPGSKNEVLIPANNIDLILDSIANVAKAHSDAHVSIVFDGLSDLLSSLDPERTFTFLRHALQILSSERTTALFLFNTSAHDPKIVSRLRSMFYDQLVYRKTGLQMVKLSKIE